MTTRDLRDIRTEELCQAREEELAAPLRKIDQRKESQEERNIKRRLSSLYRKLGET